ncbi:hypothetical protein NDU88_004025 [Pleurodeles waltl]|uniref:Uncharacterized protein n=1 Tax=Pleurodeles waltl TaxID=8319 RepID=A0AAV7W453_PLEWA|nr:hypothetical protein NDU88_004025 [Pleurodeles waltl]
MEASKASMTDSGALVAAGRERLIEVTLLTGQSLSKVSGWVDPRTKSKGALGFDEGTEDIGAEGGSAADEKGAAEITEADGEADSKGEEPLSTSTLRQHFLRF